MLVSLILSLLYSLRWLVIVLLLYITIKVLHIGIINGIMIAALYHLYLFPSMFNAAAMGVYYVAPPLWDGPMWFLQRGRVKLIRFVFSDLTFLGCCVSLAAVSLGRYVGHGDGWLDALKSVGLSSGVLFLCVCVYLTYEGFVQNRYKILLCRRYKPEVTTRVRAGLLPVLGSIGQVFTLIDPTISSQETEPSDPQGTPLFPPYALDLVPSELGSQEWQQIVREKLIEADLIIIDITDLSASVAWELAEALQLRESKDVIIVGAIQFLATRDRKRPLRDDLKRELVSIMGEAKSENIMKSAPFPIPYSEDISNRIFAWKICRWDKSG
jgi:hypothetical protein